jgi:hypothetical protein
MGKATKEGKGKGKVNGKGNGIVNKPQEGMISLVLLLCSCRRKCMRPTRIGKATKSLYI